MADKLRSSGVAPLSLDSGAPPPGGRLPESVCVWRRFLAEEDGQDYTEYALMLACVTVEASALFILTGVDFGKIWSRLNHYLSLVD